MWGFGVPYVQPAGKLQELDELSHLEGTPADSEGHEAMISGSHHV